MNLESSDEHFCKGICASTEENKVEMVSGWIVALGSTWQCMVSKDGKQRRKCSRQTFSCAL